MSKSSILFDLDGTLIDTAADFVVVMQSMCKDKGITAPSAEAIRNTVSDGARALVTLCFHIKEGDIGFEDLRNELLDRYEEELGQAAFLFDGMQAVLEKCQHHNIAWGIVTNKPWRFTEPLIKRIFSDDTLAPLYPASIICPDHVTITKPDPEGLLKAVQELNSSSKNCFYVGDHRRDIEAGINANMKTIACRYGYIKDDDAIETWQADFIIDSASELSAIIDSAFAQVSPA